MIRSIGVLLSGQAIGQALPLFALLIAASLYSPEQFAAFGMYTAITSILSAAAHLKLSWAIPALTSRDAANLAIGCILTTLPYLCIIIVIGLIAWMVFGLDIIIDV